MKKMITIIISLLIISYGNGQTDDQLKGKELTKASDVGAAVESGLGLLFGGGSIQGKIEKVLVTDETFKEIKLKITYSGFEGNWLKASVLKADRSVIGTITSAPVQLQAAVKEAVISVTRQEADTTHDSNYLKLLVCKQKNDVTGQVLYFIMQKKWKTQGLNNEKQNYGFINESLVIDLNAVPVGVAAQLKDGTAATVLPRPTNVSKMKINDVFYKNQKIERTASLKPVSTTTSSMQVKPMMFRMTTQPPPADTAKKTITMKPVTINRAALGGLTQEQVTKGAKGPGTQAFSLWDEIRSDPGVNFDFSQEYKITNVNFDIFPDKNENSGYYYYFPASYSLQWDKENSYQLKFLYGSADATTGEGMINMFMTITPSVSVGERRMIEALVRDHAVRNGKPFEKLMPLPWKESPKVDFAGILTSNYDVPADKIHTMATDIFDPVQVSWPMTSKKADDFMVALKSVNFQGNLQLVPEGELTGINIPVKIALGNDQTFGKIILQGNRWRGQLIKNEMPFPVRMKYIHALVLNQEENGYKTPYIYSWNLNDQDVPVLASVRINDATIPGFLDSKAERMWIEYSVPSCQPCMDKVINELTSGTISARQQKIEVVSYGIIERTGAYVIEVTVRSKFADPKGQSIMEITPLKVKADDQSYQIGPLFIPEEQKLEFEYKIKLVTDNEVLNSDWIYATEPTLYLTKSLVEKALGKFPEKTP
jgi:hypothetical protein